MSTELFWSIAGNKQGLRERLPGNRGVLLVSNLLAGKSCHFGVLSACAYWTSGFKMWCLVMLALRTPCSAPVCATQHKQRTCGFLNALTDIWSVWGGTYELSLWCASSLHPVWKYSSDILQSCMLQWGTLLASSCRPPSASPGMHTFCSGAQMVIIRQHSLSLKPSQMSSWIFPKSEIVLI